MREISQSTVIEDNVNHWARVRQEENFRVTPTTYTSVEEYLDRKKCGIGVGFSYNANTHKFTRHIVRCKKRSCSECEPFWRSRQLSRLQQREANDLFHGKQYTHYHVVLTTASRVDKEKVYAAFRYFFQIFRKEVGQVEYYCSVEQNKKATQPHFHLLLAFEGDVSWVDYRLIRSAWEKAQKQAHFPSIANQTFTKRLEGDNIGWYMLKYITKNKEGDKSYEVPTREVWDGRHIRYSVRSSKKRGFFPVSVAVLDISFQASQCLKEPGKSSYYDFSLLPSVDEACNSGLDFMQGIVGILEVVKGTWNIHADYCNGSTNPEYKPFGGSVELTRTLKAALQIFC